MAYIKVYALLSVVIALVYTSWKSWKNRSKIIGKDMESSRTRFLEDSSVGKEHIQKEMYGARKVFHPKDPAGHAAIDAVDTFDNLAKSHPFFAMLILFAVGFISTVITWPHLLYKKIVASK